ncbi:hypothetical protein Q7A53_07585 [Halobacillus rhizosphaerae]|uniref:hypothetical protein n=1 Tax=Halobacillus rhizosphaerae TaxID=3064889 RepID=UPI00398A6D66
MEREELHRKIISLKGKICSGQIKFDGSDHYILSQLDKVKQLEDGMVDVNTVPAALITLINLDSLNPPQKQEAGL